MGRIFDSGFELNSTVDGMEFADSDSGTKPQIVVTPLYSGQYVQRSQAARDDFKHLLVSSLSDAQVYLRVWIYVKAVVDTTTRIFYLVEAGTSDRASIRLTSTNTLQLFGTNVQIGSDSRQLALKEWNCIEIGYKNNLISGKAEVSGRLNGAVFASTTTGTETGSWDSLIVGNGDGTTTGDIYFDDLSVNDATGSFQNSWPGVSRLAIYRPSGAGDSNTFGTQTGGIAGSGNNFTRVMEVTPDNNTHNASNTLNQEDMFAMSPLNVAQKILSTDTINCVTVHLRARNGGAVGDATTTVKPQIKKVAAGTITQGLGFIPNDGTNFLTDTPASPWIPGLVAHQDPDGVNWTPQTIASMQCGYKLTATGTNSIQVTAVWVYVDYTPAGKSRILINNLRPRIFAPGIAR